MKKFVNLLPDEEKKAVKKEYFVRRRIVSFSLFLYVILICIFALVPSYLAARSRLSIVNSELANIQNKASQSTFDELEKIIVQTKRNLDIMNKVQKVASSHDLFEKILNVKGEKISITSFTFEQDVEKKTLSLSVAGIADTRDSLAQFARSLENIDVFTKVDVPVSNFAKDKNIDFTLVLKGSIK